MVTDSKEASDNGPILIPSDIAITNVEENSGLRDNIVEQLARQALERL